MPLRGEKHEGYPSAYPENSLINALLRVFPLKEAREDGIGISFEWVPEKKWVLSNGAVKLKAGISRSSGPPRQYIFK